MVGRHVPPHGPSGCLVRTGRTAEPDIYPAGVERFQRSELFSDDQRARTYAKVIAISYGGLVILGLIPGLNTLFGLVPIFGHDVWLHAVLAIPAAYFGFMRRDGDAHGTSH
jgi:hypothetical protein